MTGHPPECRVRREPETGVVRPSGWQAANGLPGSWTRRGHLYRGMSEAEYVGTVGAGRGVESDGRYCANGEGACFDEDASCAESYANFGRSDPRITDVPTYVVEIEAGGAVRRDADGYWKARHVPQDMVRRVWRMSADGDTIVAMLVRRPSASECMGDPCQQPDPPASRPR